MYLLSVLSSDRTAEITFLLSLNSSYSTLPSSLPSIAVSNIHRTALAHHTHRFYNPTYAGLITSLTAENSKPAQVKENVPKKDQAPQPNNQDEAAGTLRSQYGRFLPPPPTSPPTRHAYLSTLEEVLGKYYNEEKAAGSPTSGEEVNWVYLATPFVCCYARPVAVFLAFQKLMERISTSPILPCLHRADAKNNSHQCQIGYHPS
jgi:hypothetical protein